MSLIKTIILCSIAVLVLTACSPKNPYPVENNISIENEGILILSTKNICNFIGATGVPMYYIRSTDQQVSFRGVGDTATSKEFISECSTLDFYNLPAGEYEIYSWKVSKITAFSAWREKPKNDFSIKFTIKPNKINYLGQIHLDQNHTISFSNMEKRDLNTFHSRYPQLVNLEVIYPLDFSYQLSNYGEILSTEKTGVYHPIILPVGGK